MDYRIFYAVVFLLFTLTEGQKARDCPERYQRFSATHSYCEPKNPSCEIAGKGVTRTDIYNIVNSHNRFRNTIALQQKGSNGLPAAADMLQMEWDKELSEVAQRYAEQCKLDHDTNEQRRVLNFKVGQNIAMWGYDQVAKPNWEKAISSFFEEIKDFSKEMVCGIRNPKGPTGHFNQLVWAETFRVGCGYTMFKTPGADSAYVQLYVCNYGPGGNYKDGCVYQPGEACGKCPVNTKCADDQSVYDGLCRRINKKVPFQPKDEQPYFLNCNFHDFKSEDCGLYSLGDGDWFIFETLSESYLENVLWGGQNGTVVFKKLLIPSPDEESFCVQIRYRSGPHLAKDRQNNAATAFFFANSNFHAIDLGNFRDFGKYKITMDYNESTELKIAFIVPHGAERQFINIASVVAYDGECDG